MIDRAVRRLRQEILWAREVAGGGASDHGALTGLADDDHSQYHNNARGDARYPLIAHSHAYPDLTGLPTTAGINPKDAPYNAPGGGADATAEVQAAFSAAAAGDGLIRLTEPYLITDTITVTPGGSQEYLNIVTDLPRPGVAFNWGGGNNKPMFKVAGWKNSVVRGVQLNTLAGTGVIGWDFEVNATQTSAGNHSFYDCAVIMAAADCIGWRGAPALTGAGDVAFVNFFNCFANGGSTSYNNVGWNPQRNNCLVWNWYGGGGFYLGKSFSNVRPGGGEAGGGAMNFYGFGTSGNLWDFEFATAGSYLVVGGRYEAGERFMQVGGAGATSGFTVDVRGTTIGGYTPSDGILFNLDAGVLLTLDSTTIQNTGGADYDANMITMIDASSPPNYRYGAVNVKGCIVQSSDPFYTLPGSGRWRIGIEDCAIRNSANAGLSGMFAEPGGAGLSSPQALARSLGA